MAVNKQRIMWSEQDVALLQEKYFTSTAEELMRLFPTRGIEAIRKKARKMGMYVPADMESENRSSARSGERCCNWKGGKKNHDGYTQILCREHPRADKTGYVLEHIYVWEKETGAAVPNGFCIHHINGDKSDNRIENLCMMTTAAHVKLHHRGKSRTDEARQKMSEKAKERLSDKKNHPRYKEIDMEEVARMREQGMTIAAICKELGMDRTTYYRKMREINAK